MSCVMPFCVVDWTSGQAAMNARPPASAELGSPASVGKLLHRNAEPPPSRKQAPVDGSSMEVMLRIVTSAAQLVPPSAEKASLMCAPLLQLQKATMSSPLASNAGDVPLPQLSAVSLIDELPNVQFAPPLSVNALNMTWPPDWKSVHVRTTRPKCGLAGLLSAAIIGLSTL